MSIRNKSEQQGKDSFTFIQAWALIKQEDQKEFWDIAAKFVKTIPIPKKQPLVSANGYDALCAAIEDVERKGELKGSVNGIPRTPVTSRTEFD